MEFLKFFLPCVEPSVLIQVVGDLGQVLFCPFELKDEDSIRRAVQHSTIVINLIGRGIETSNFSFEDVNIRGPAAIARICREMGVKRLVHMSSINARSAEVKINYIFVTVLCNVYPYWFQGGIRIQYFFVSADPDADPDPQHCFVGTVPWWDFGSAFILGAFGSIFQKKFPFEFLGFSYGTVPYFVREMGG
jgi:hypothetical protein